MLFSYYQETSLEQWINAKYLSYGLHTANDCEIERIADAFEVDIMYVSCPSFSENEDKVIFLNKDVDDKMARIIFFHELCHVLRHAGDQRVMPPLFKEAQESEADHFVLYASVPFYMFRELSIPDQRSEAIPFIADTFHIPLDWAEKRLDQIQRRVLHGSLLAAAQEADRHPGIMQYTRVPDNRNFNDDNFTLDEPIFKHTDYNYNPTMQREQASISDGIQPDAIVDTVRGNNIESQRDLYQYAPHDSRQHTESLPYLIHDSLEQGKLRQRVRPQAPTKQQHQPNQRLHVSSRLNELKSRNWSDETIRILTQLQRQLARKEAAVHENIRFL